MIPASLYSLMLLGGCQVTVDDCDRHEALGTQLGLIGLPADADRHDVPAACIETFEQAWGEAVADYCEPANGFAVGNSDAVYYGVCRDADFEAAYRLGRALWVLLVEAENLELRLQALDRGDVEPTDAGETSRIRMRLRTIERDRPELETLARIRGLLPPVDAETLN